MTTPTGHPYALSEAQAKLMQRATWGLLHVQYESWGVNVVRSYTREVNHLLTGIKGERRGAARKDSVEKLIRDGLLSRGDGHQVRPTPAGRASLDAFNGVPVPVVTVAEPIAETLVELPAPSVAETPEAAIRRHGEESAAALGDLRKHVKDAQQEHTWAGGALSDAEGALTRAEARKAAETADSCAEDAEKALKDAKKARTRVRAARKAIDNLTTGDSSEAAEEIRATASANEADAEELYGEAEEAAEGSKECAESAWATADDDCMTCGEFTCACREIVSAILAKCGGPVTDERAVAIGRMYLSDDVEIIEAGQLALALGEDVPEFGVDAVEDVAQAEPVAYAVGDVVRLPEGIGLSRYSRVVEVSPTAARCQTSGYLTEHDGARWVAFGNLEHAEVPLLFIPMETVYFDGRSMTVDHMPDEHTVTMCGSGSTFRAEELTRAADMPEVTYEKLGDGCWKIMRGDVRMTAHMISHEVVQSPKSYSCVIVDDQGQQIGRSPGVPIDQTIHWVSAHPGTPRPGDRFHFPEGLPEMSDAEREYIGTGRSLVPRDAKGNPVKTEETAQDQEQGETMGRRGLAPKTKAPTAKVRDILFATDSFPTTAQLLGHFYAIRMLAGCYSVTHNETGERLLFEGVDKKGQCRTGGDMFPTRPTMKQAILADAVARGEAEQVEAEHQEQQPEPVADESSNLPGPLRKALAREAAEEKRRRRERPWEYPLDAKGRDVEVGALVVGRWDESTQVGTVTELIKTGSVHAKVSRVGEDGEETTYTDQTSRMLLVTPEQMATVRPTLVVEFDGHRGRICSGNPVTRAGRFYVTCVCLNWGHLPQEGRSRAAAWFASQEEAQAAWERHVVEEGAYVDPDEEESRARAACASVGLDFDSLGDLHGHHGLIQQQRAKQSSAGHFGEWWVNCTCPGTLGGIISHPGGCSWCKTRAGAVLLWLDHVERHQAEAVQVEDPSPYELEPVLEELADRAENREQPQPAGGPQDSVPADTEEIPVKPQPTPGLYAPVLEVEERDGTEAEACRKDGHRYVWLCVEAEGVSRTLRSYLTCACTGEKLGNFGRSGPSMNQGTQTKPLGIRDASIASALGVAKRNDYSTQGPWEIVSETLKRCPVAWDHAKPLAVAVDPAREKSVRERLRAELDAQPKATPGHMAALLEQHVGPDWKPLEATADPQFEDAPEAEQAPVQGLAPVTREQRRAAWRLAAGEPAPVVEQEPKAVLPSAGKGFWEVGERVLHRGRAGRVVGAGIGVTRVAMDGSEPGKLEHLEPRELVAERYVVCGTLVTLTVPALPEPLVMPQAPVCEALEEYVMPEVPALVVCGGEMVPTMPERSEPVRDWFAPVVAPALVVDEDGPDYAAISAANRAAAVEQVDILAELRAELEAIRDDVDTWGAEVAALAVAEAERVVREVAADLRRAEVLALREEAVAVRELLEHEQVVVPVEVPGRVRPWRSMFATATTVAGLVSAGFAEGWDVGMRR
ncbi:hypothetical protein [Streptomyces sp. NPDC056401]|uniref:hypothetical protein n=1 Tax=Streptomyces sp. NPDC056401 TaxID=3345809 RepID=UPI0035DFE2E7